MSAPNSVQATGFIISQGETPRYPKSAPCERPERRWAEAVLACACGLLGASVIRGSTREYMYMLQSWREEAESRLDKRLSPRRSQLQGDCGRRNVTDRRCPRMPPSELRVAQQRVVAAPNDPAALIALGQTIEASLSPANTSEACRVQEAALLVIDQAVISRRGLVPRVVWRPRSIVSVAQ